jgi:hypothetical protein
VATRPLRVCKACKDALCAECANWVARSDWCEHPCAEVPKQLSLFQDHLGGPLRPAERTHFHDQTGTQTKEG